MPSVFRPVSFEGKEEYGSFELLLEAMKAYSVRNKMLFTTKRYGPTTAQPYNEKSVQFFCQRSGKPRTGNPRLAQPGLPEKNTASLKCGCNFMLWAKEREGGKYAVREFRSEHTNGCVPSMDQVRLGKRKRGGNIFLQELSHTQKAKFAALVSKSAPPAAWHALVAEMGLTARISKKYQMYALKQTVTQWTNKEAANAASATAKEGGAESSEPPLPDGCEQQDVSMHAVDSCDIDHDSVHAVDNCDIDHCSVAPNSQTGPHRAPPPPPHQPSQAIVAAAEGIVASASGCPRAYGVVADVLQLLHRWLQLDVAKGHGATVRRQEYLHSFGQFLQTFSCSVSASASSSAASSPFSSSSSSSAAAASSSSSAAGGICARGGGAIVPPTPTFYSWGGDNRGGV